MRHLAPRPLAVLFVAISVPAAALAAGNLVVSGSLVSTVATGTPPLAVSSTTKVDGLNADLLDGLDSGDLFTSVTDGSGSGLDADLLDGLDGSAFARSLGNVVRVGTSGGDFTSIQAALDAITTASSFNPFLILVGPGIYDERVEMKPFVDIQGAGEGVTRITQSGGTTTERGTVAGADDAELRFLTVENTGGSSFVYGVYNDATSPRLVHVTIEVDGSAATVFGIENTDTSTELRHVTVLVEGSATAWGVLNAGGSVRMENVRVEVGGSGSGSIIGVSSNQGTGMVLDDVEIVATSTGGGSVRGLTNAALVDATIRDVRVEASGGTFNTGVENNLLTSLTLRDLEVEVSDGTGVFNWLSTVILENCSIHVSGGNFPTAIEFEDASGGVNDCTLHATDGSLASVGIVVESSTEDDLFTVAVQQSRVRGADYAIRGIVASPYTVRVGASQLDGTVDTGPTYACVYAYDGNFAPVICP